MRTTYLIKIGIVLLMSCLIGCQKDHHDEDVLTDTTVIIYQAAQNSLGNKGYHRQDLQEIIAGIPSIPKNSQILVFTDDGHPRIVRFRSTSPTQETIKEWPQDLCSTDPQVFEHVLSWIHTHYPSKHYGLVLWSHANGWIPSNNTNYSAKSFGVDVGAEGNPDSDLTADGKIGAQMNITDLAQAIEKSGIAPCKYLFFDACLMQNMENIYTLRQVTQHLIASPILIPAEGADYTHQIKNGLFAPHPKQIAQTYYEDIKNEAHIYNGYGIVISCVNTAFVDSFTALFREGLKNSAFAQSTYPSTQTLFSYQDADQQLPPFYDMYSVISQLFYGNQKALLQALNQMVEYKAATDRFYMTTEYGPYGAIEIFKDVAPNNYCGISIYVPEKRFEQPVGIWSKRGFNRDFQTTPWYAATWSILH